MAIALAREAKRPRLRNQSTIGLWPNTYAYVAREKRLYMPIARDARHTSLYELGNVLAREARQGTPLNRVTSLWLKFAMVLRPTGFSEHIATLSQPFLHRTVAIWLIIFLNRTK